MNINTTLEHENTRLFDSANTGNTSEVDVFDGINIIDFVPRTYTPAIWHIETETEFDEDNIIEGDFVRYYDKDYKCVRVGQFINLWEWAHPGETSPDYGDDRVMAYIITIEDGSKRGTYADVTTITLCDERDDYGFIFDAEVE